MLFVGHLLACPPQLAPAHPRCIAHSLPRFKSSLLNTGTHDLSAAWALDRPTNAFRRPSTPPHLSRHLPDKHARTHRIIGQSEAIYCEWVGPSALILLNVSAYLGCLLPPG